MNQPSVASLDHLNQLLQSTDLGAEQAASLQRATEAMARIRALDAQNRLPTAADSGVITAHAYWWGWHLDVPHNQVEPLLQGAENVSKLIEIGLSVVPELGEILGLAVNVYVQAMKAIIKTVDKGNGVYLSQTWAIEGAIIASGGLFTAPLIPVMFIPTTR